MNKKIPTELAIGIILIVTVIAGGYFLLFENKISDTVYEYNFSKNYNAEQKKITPENYVEYLNKEKGISFTYPKWWGGVKFSPHENTPFISFIETDAPTIYMLSNKSGLESMNCPTEENIVDFLGRDAVMEDVIYCKKNKIDNQTVIQLYSIAGGEGGNLGSRNSYGVFILTRIFSPNGSMYAEIDSGTPESMICRDCDMTYKDFIKLQKDEIKYLVESCLIGNFSEWTDEKSGLLTRKGCNSDSVRFIFELDSLIHSIGINDIT